MAWGGPPAPSMSAGWGGFLEEAALSAGPGQGPSPPTICLEIWEKPLPFLAGASRQVCGRPGRWGVRGFAVSGAGSEDGVLVVLGRRSPHPLAEEMPLRPRREWPAGSPARVHS